MIKINVTFRRDSDEGFEQVEHNVVSLLMDKDGDLTIYTAQGSTIVYAHDEYVAFAVQKED